VKALGIALRTGVQTRRLLGENAVSGVELDNGTVLPAEIVVISAGVRANLELAKAAGLTVNQGIVVDDAMQTSCADIYAAGDGAEHAGVMYGTWLPAQRQGATAGASAAGQAAAFAPLPRSATLKAVGVDVFSIGQVAPANAGDRLVEAELGGDYACFLWREQVLAGAILLGDTRLAPQVKTIIESRMPCPPLATATEVLQFVEHP